jgi:hypothetical protein
VIGGDLQLNLAGNVNAELEINENQTARMRERANFSILACA